MNKRGTRSPKRRTSQQDRKLHTRQIGEAFQRATDAHRTGDLASAERLYGEIVSRDPQHADAWHLLGFAEFQSRQFREAIQHIQRAISLRPDNGEYHHNLALTLLASERLEEVAAHARLARDNGYQDAESYLQVGLELYHQHKLASAEASFQLAQEIDRSNADAHHFLGIVRKSQGQLDEAISFYEQAIVLRPAYVEAMNNLGNAFRERERYDAAIEAYRRAIDITPTFAAAHNNLGVTYQRCGDEQQAIDCYQRACELDASNIEARNNLGSALRQRGMYSQAIAALQEALRLDPGCLEAHVNLGAAYHAARQLEPAIEHLRAAHRGDPTSPELLVKLAAALAAHDRLDEAQECYAKLQQIQPEQKLWSLSAAALCPPVFASATESERHWNEIERAVDRLADDSLKLSPQELFTLAPPPPFTLQFFAGNLRPIKQQFAAVYHSMIERLNEELSGYAKNPECRTDERIRVGFVATPGKEGVFLRSMQGVIERLDAERFAPVIVCWQPSVGILERAIQQPRIPLVVVPNGWRQLAQTLLAQALDILYYFEIGTDAANYFLPFLRLAPTQCTSWGIQVTSGIPNVDHYLSSRLIETPEAAGHYSENLTLAETLLCYRTRTPMPLARKSREQFGFTPGRSLYVCAQQLGKFHTDFDPMIAAILRQDECGVLAVTGDRSGVAAGRLRERFSTVMPDVADRIVLLPQLERDKYRSLLLAADVLLDPPHFGGVNSTYDGLSYGQPIVTLPSDFHRGRYTLGCYRKMQLDECVASSVDEYVQLAKRLARDRDYRKHMSERIHTASPALFEDAAAVREHERLFGELVASKRRD